MPWCIGRAMRQPNRNRRCPALPPGDVLLGRLEEAVGLFDRMRAGHLPADSPVLAARRGAWRRLLALYAVISVVCVVFAITSDDLTVPLALLAFAVLNLPPLWFVFFRTVPKGRT